MLDNPRFFISAAEPSGDQHAAGLIHAVRARLPEATFWGVAGPKMQEAGCEAIDDMTSRSAMLVGAVRLAGHAWMLIRRIGREVREERPDAAILVDSPALHLPMAKPLHTAGGPILYYVAPQYWAWAPWRIRRFRKRIDALATLLPFEEEYFQSRGVNAQFVGHPLIEQLSERRIDHAMVQQLEDTGSPVIASLPGSRKHVIEEVLPGQMDVAERIAAEFPEASFLFLAAHEKAADRIRNNLAASTLNAQIVVHHNGEALTAADFALCASGTATLEVAYYNVPMVVMYNGSKWGYRLVGKRLITTEHLSLVNILAGREIVPEFMPYYTRTEPIAQQAMDILRNDERRTRIKADLAEIVASLGSQRAADGAAQMLIETIWKKRRFPHTLTVS